MSSTTTKFLLINLLKIKKLPILKSSSKNFNNQSTKVSIRKFHTTKFVRLYTTRSLKLLSSKPKIKFTAAQKKYLTEILGKSLLSITICGSVLFTSYWLYKDRRKAIFYCIVGSILISYCWDENNHDFCGRQMLWLALKNGGVYVKVGQHLSAMAHVIPEDITKHLKCLQQKCTEQPIENIQLVLKSELDKEKYNDIIDLVEKPEGTASIAQVHRARLKVQSQTHSGKAAGEDTFKEIVVKVQHLDIAQNADTDMKLLTYVCDKIKKNKMFGHKFNLHWLVKELNVLLQDELDFVKEASNATEARYNHRHLSWLVIPRVFQEYTTKRVLVMDYEAGASIDDTEFYKTESVDPSVVIDRISYLFNEMIFIKGFLHSDPHAGNLRVRKCGPIGPVQVILLDHGQYKRLNSVFHHNYCNFLNAIMTSDAKNILKYAANLEIKKETLAKQLACMMTGMSWEQIEDSTMTTSGRSHESTWGSDGRTKELVDRHLDKALEILETIPPELTIIMKSNDLIRCLEHKLTDGTSPEVYLNLACLCLKGMKRLELIEYRSTQLFPSVSRAVVELSYLPSFLKIYITQNWFYFKAALYRKYNNYSLFFGAFFWDMSHRKMKKSHGVA